MAMPEELDTAAAGGGGGGSSSGHGNNTTSVDVVGGGGNRVASVRFNQDYGCFACATDTGFRIYNCDPLEETCRRDFRNGGLGLVEMLYRCKMLALVGGGAAPLYPPNKIMIWDVHQSRCIGELSFRSEVRAVRLRRDRIVAVLEHKIYIYNFADLKLLDHIKTIPNPKGLCALSLSSNSCILACPGLLEGQVHVENYSLKKKQVISAHGSSLACFALTSDGHLLATASVKGTLVRIFNTISGTPLQELRRGAMKAEIYSIVFSSSARWLALTSDKRTVHVFEVNVPPSAESDIADVGAHPEASTKATIVASGNGVPRTLLGSSPSLSPVRNTGSSFSFMKGVLPSYFSSEWSHAHYRLPNETHAIVAFGNQENTVVIVGTDGSFYRCLFDPAQGGDMVQQEFAKFLRPD